MKNYKFKRENGVSLISLIVTIVVLIIITNILIYNLKGNLRLGNLKNMQNDINSLSQKISSYYAKNGKIPINQEYKNTGILNSIIGATDTGKFYIIDLSSLENLTLNYGEDFKNINEESTEEQINAYTDLYIINETSHNIFYVEGINVDDNIYYTYYGADDKDTQPVDLRYVENVKIPSGYSYLSGTKNTGIRIKNNLNNLEYTWIVINNKLTNIPNDVQIESQYEEQFKKSANLYKGYYKSTSDNSVIYLGLEEEWTPKYDKSGRYKDKNGNIVTVPQGFQVCTTVGKNTVEDGLVIRNANKYEGSNDKIDDRYVWIEVPKSVYTTANSQTDYENIENDLQNYITSYREGASNFKDKWYAIDNTTEINEDMNNLTDNQKNLTSNCWGLTHDEYIEVREEMYSNIFKNGGFWIGQYEAGVEDERQSNATDLTTAKSNVNLYPYNWVKCSEAQGQANDVNSGDFTSSLMFGIQWDLVLKFIETKSDKIKYDINVNSSSWGEYNQICTTGYSDEKSVLNIYDLAGNVSEWTLEYSGDNSEPSCIRGGNSSNNDQFASKRIKKGIDDNEVGIGFRVVLY